MIYQQTYILIYAVACRCWRQAYIYLCESLTPGKQDRNFPQGEQSQKEEWFSNGHSWAERSWEAFSLQQIACRMNSTTRPQGPNNRETLRNTHCCSDCHILQIINCQGSCHPTTTTTTPPFSPPSPPLSLSLLLLNDVAKLDQPLIICWHILAVFTHERSAIAQSRGRRRGGVGG